MYDKYCTYLGKIHLQLQVNVGKLHLLVEPRPKGWLWTNIILQPGQMLRLVQGLMF